MLYRNFSTLEEIDAQYDLAASSDSFPGIMETWISQGESVRSSFACELDVAFGPTRDETMDIFPAEKESAPIVVFIHGGYWRALSSKEFSFIVPGLHELGYTVVVTNYSLCPAVTISEITRQSRAAISWIAKHADRYNGNPGNINVIGHSAGGQQAAMMCATNWVDQYNLPADLIKTAIPMSGIFDLEPLRHSYLQPALQLDHQLISQQSPLFHIPSSSTRILVTLGEGEPEEFHRQGKEYHAAWESAGNEGEFTVQKGHDHFTLLNDFSGKDSPLLQSIDKLIG